MRLRFLFLMVVFGTSSVWAQDAATPPTARPGECYARVLYPPTTRTVTDRVIKREAGQKIEVIPARYETVTERVLVEEASERVLETIPAQYDTVTEQVEIEPATFELVHVPAEYETVEERILESPAYTMWKRGSGPAEIVGGGQVQVDPNTGKPITKVDINTGSIMCLVEVPAKYKTIAKRVVKTPPRTERREIPAKYQTITKRVMTKPPEVRTEPVPARYENVPVQKLVEPAQQRTVEIPAEYETVTREEVVTEGRVEWAGVLCEVNATEEVIREVQMALQREGFFSGTADGSFSPMLNDAIKRYQESKKLATGALTLETVQSLGLNF